ncbi:hypothetical protein NUW54_g1613 [Trametes sanguinea]|uniref:Uncharacterized protein n=1 Tax=Trametes sanguinea TaxID=158606 RepID=A0ACC1Q6G9_9APHY|nr:hypothetical protein NUW54_g1613 [Trametes sanguinea]
MPSGPLSRRPQGVMAGYDQKSNVVLSDSKERVYSMDEGVEEIPLGLYLVKGDQIADRRAGRGDGQGCRPVHDTRRTAATNTLLSSSTSRTVLRQPFRLWRRSPRSLSLASQNAQIAFCTTARHCAVEAAREICLDAPRVGGRPGALGAATTLAGSQTPARYSEVHVLGLCDILEFVHR